MNVTAHPSRERVGELRPSQILFSFGVGATVDLPSLSVMVMGLDDWPLEHCAEVGEERLLAAVREKLGAQVQGLRLPPITAESPMLAGNPFEEAWRIGVPVATFPRWMRCPACSILKPLNSGLFELRAEPFRPDRTRYVHRNCNKAARAPAVVPARFLVGCKNGHLDDFPWLHFVHRGAGECPGDLVLTELGATGEAQDIIVRCMRCPAKRSMAQAFGETDVGTLPPCRGRRPHLRDFDEKPCEEGLRAILLGASNLWFPVSLSALAIPTATNRLEQLVNRSWPVLEKVTSPEVLAGFRSIGQLNAFAEYSEAEIWEAAEQKRTRQAEHGFAKPAWLRSPEWGVFAHPDPQLNSDDFRLREVAPPAGFERLVQRVVLVERLREVRALIGFTRIVSPGDLGDSVDLGDAVLAPIARRPPSWVPASEVRGEGIFIQLAEDALQAWAAGPDARARGAALLEGHTRWREARRIAPAAEGFPGLRYVLVHSLAHALMRQFAVECGYTLASIRERVYARPGGSGEEPSMAGLLIYTAAPDSEGTLGGLVRLGEPGELARHLYQALEHARLCSSDPLCAEHDPAGGSPTLHAAACHACQFVPETSCERGNKYLDRALLVPTFGRQTGGFFALAAET